MLNNSHIKLPQTLHEQDIFTIQTHVHINQSITISLYPKRYYHELIDIFGDFYKDPGHRGNKITAPGLQPLHLRRLQRRKSHTTSEFELLQTSLLLLINQSCLICQMLAIFLELNSERLYEISEKENLNKNYCFPTFTYISFMKHEIIGGLTL